MIKNQKGFLLIVALIVILIFSVIGVVATYLLTQNTLSATNHLKSQQALNIADAGLESAAHQLTRATIANRTSCEDITDNVNLTDITFTGAAGPFTVTGAVKIPSTATTLSSAITASDTTIPLTSSANYSSAGRIMIDGELIDYSKVTGNNLLNVVRGAAGTIAAAHASGAPVGQYDCDLQSEGGAPTLSPSGNIIGGMRTINESVQLPMAWAVGNSSSSRTRIMRWNAPTELSWNDASINLSSDQNLNSVFALSYADAWAVGANGLILHWTGSSWASSTSNTTIALNSVYCTASNNCWAVGGTATSLVFDLWNGSSWTVQTTSVSTLTARSYNSVYCVSSNDCWAVANSISGSSPSNVVVHWNGSAWTQNSTATGLTPIRNLRSVTCVGSDFCEAAGVATGSSRAFMTWNGSAWSNQSVTSISGTTYDGITCVTTTDCWAVANDGTIARWNGSAWSTSTTSSGNLNGISCSAMNIATTTPSLTTTDQCWAVGNSAASLYWDGNSWTSISNPLGVNLNSVSVVNAPIQLIIGSTPYTIFAAPVQPVAAWQEYFP